MTQYIPIFLLISSALINADSIRISNVSQAALYYDYTKKKWEVEKYGTRYEIATWLVDKIARDIPEDKIEVFLKHVALKVSELDNSEYALSAHVRGLGGGPQTAKVLACTVGTIGMVSVYASSRTAILETGSMIASYLHAPDLISLEQALIIGGALAAMRLYICFNLVKEATKVAYAIGMVLPTP